MRGRKHLTANERFNNFGLGTVGLVVAFMIAKYGNFEWNIAISFVVGLVALGGIFRGLFGFDEV
ncbi:hypothetical protein [Roseobacter litoralis]|uniref:Uncharacterized protein n=1 Tax=Roseobacter litoralis (strain ATCC 49566 / DSM 6996 / JCM 21268 / NBRC 15278 / OCh 149) TaxID=391595 RepID=F7ZB84_ROSLO|nr:hypothetical protein [Roseobacter litoralis]AEI93077.1 hypothetical protein RLO149_c010700 [Roseobacter litoralis Och 149]